MNVLGQYRIGASFSAGIDLVDGDIADVQSVTAMMRRIKTNPDGTWSFAVNHVPVVLGVAERLAAGSVPNGWNVSLSAADTENLTPGLYALDARFALSGSVVVTEESVFIKMTKGAL